MPERSLVALIDKYITMAANGQAQEALAELQGSDIAWQVQPLIAGLRLFLGEDRNTVHRDFNIMELEVGDDVAERIRKRQALIQET